MKTVANIIAQIARDEHGSATIEYALVAGLLVVVSLGVVGAYGTKVLARWTSLNGSM
jgi:Flp pilus assembly pilin Flp